MPCREHYSRACLERGGKPPARRCDGGGIVEAPRDAGPRRFIPFVGTGRELGHEVVDVVAERYLGGLEPAELVRAGIALRNDMREVREPVRPDRREIAVDDAVSLDRAIEIEAVQKRREADRCRERIAGQDQDARLSGRQRTPSGGSGRVGRQGRYHEARAEYRLAWLPGGSNAYSTRVAGERYAVATKPPVAKPARRRTYEGHHPRGR